MEQILRIFFISDGNVTRMWILLFKDFLFKVFLFVNKLGFSKKWMKQFVKFSVEE